MAVTNENKEIECRFLEIDKEALIKKLRDLGAEDKGELMQEETIFYNEDHSWAHVGRRVRLRKAGNDITMTYKERHAETIDGVLEIEFGIDDAVKAELLLQKIGLDAARKQQKLRHAFSLDNVAIDIDTWPKVPTYVELEGESEDQIHKVADKIGLDWNDMNVQSVGKILEDKYNIPIRQLKFFTFDRFE